MDTNILTLRGAQRKRRSRLQPAFPVFSGKAGFFSFRKPAQTDEWGRLNPEKVSESAIYRTFLTAFVGCCRLFGKHSYRGRGSEPARTGPVRRLFGTPFGHFWPKPATFGQKRLISPKVPAGAGKSRLEPAPEVPNIQPFCRLLSRKTGFLSLFDHLLSLETDSGGPTHRFWEERDGRMTSLSSRK